MMNTKLTLQKELSNGTIETLCDIPEFSYTASRMGDAPSITATINRSEVRFVDNSCFVTFNGDRFYAQYTPDTTKSNDDARYKYNATFYSPRIILNNILFFDVTSTAGQLASKSSDFKFSGTIIDLVDKLNLAIRFAGLDDKFEIVINDESKYAADEAKLITFQNSTVNEAIQQIFKSFEEEYYVERENGKYVFHVGSQDSSNIATVLEYGADKSLLRITKRSKTNKIINRITGVGSSENIPYFYPNESPTGHHIVLSNTITQDGANINYEMLSAKTDLGEGCTLSYWKQLKGRDVMTFNFRHIGSNAVEATKATDSNYYTTERLAQDIVQNFTDGGDDYMYSAEFSIELGDAENGRYLCAIKPFVDASYRKGYRRSSSSSSTSGGTSESRPNGDVIVNNRRPGTLPSSRTSSGYSSSRTGSTSSSSGRTSNSSTSRPSATGNYEDVAFDKVEIYVVGVFPNTASTTAVDYTVSDDGTISFDSGIGRVLKFKVRAKKSDMGKIKQLWMDVSYIDNSDDFTKDDNFIDMATNKLIKASESGISLVGEATSGGLLTISKTLTSIPHQDKLMPSIYRGTYGNERFYEAVNNEVTIEGEISSDLSGYEENKYRFSYSFDGHEFDNPFVAGNRCEHIVEFDHIKPTIKGAKYLGSPIDVFEDFDYDVNDNDELDEKNTLKHSFFYAKLKPLGFNLFASASEQGNMTISFTNGDCAACVFEIVVDKESNKNILLTKNVNGSYVVDKGEDGKAKLAATASETQAHQNDTTNTSVWIALRKDNKTFNETFPNSKTGMLPTTSDNFVITNINLPLIYITEAEERLEEAIKQYLIDNNSEHFNYDIKFSRIFLANHIEDVFDKLNENSSLYARLYPNDDAQLLYVSSYTYTMRNGESLPEVSITLDDNVTTSTTPKQAMISSITSEVMSNVARMNILAQGSKYFLRKDQSDVTEHTITANEIVVKNNSKVEGDSFVRGGVEVDKNVVVKQNLFVDQYSKFGDIAQFSNEAIFGTFSDTIGTITGAKISPEGNAAFNSIKANYFDVYTLRYNEIRGSSAFTYFDDTATIVEIAPILNSDGTKKTPEQFTLWLDAGDDTYLHPFKNYDILYGYVNAIGDSGETAVGGQCWMRVISMRDGTYSIDVEMYADEDCPAGKNILPTTNMTFAHRGNCYPSSGPDSEQYIGRKNTFFISAKDGHVVQLLDVTHPKLYTLTDESNPNNYSNYGVVMGKLPPDLLAYVNKYHSFVHKDDPVLYAKYVAVQNFLQLDYAGRPIKTERYRGAWSQDNANGSDKYRAESAQDVTYYDTVAYDGSKWQCMVDKTTKAPKEGESDWAIIVRKGDSATSAYVANLSNQFDSVGTTADGYADAPYTISTTVSLFYGSKKITLGEGEVLAEDPHENITAVVTGDTITYTIASGDFVPERNHSEITVKHEGMEDKKLTFTIAGVRAGDNGAPATIYRLIPSSSQIVKNKDGEYEPTEITFTGSYKLTGGVRDNINGYKINCYVGEDWNTSGTVGNVNLKVKDKKITQPITVYLYDENGEVADVETIAFVEDGDKGDDGKNGLSPNPNLMLNSNLNLVVNRQVTGGMISNYYGEKWVRITRKANSNHYAMIKDNRARFEPYQDIVGLDWCLLYDSASGYFRLCNRALGPSKALKARSVGSGHGFDFVSIAESTLFGHRDTNDGYTYFYVKGDENLGLNSWGGGSQGDLALYGGGISDTGNQWSVNIVSIDRQKFLYWDYVYGDITQNGGFNQIGNNYTGIAMKTSLFAASGVAYTLSMSLISFATDVIIDFTSPDYSGGVTIECKHPRAAVNGTVVTIAATNEQTEIAITLKHSLQVQQIPLLIYTSNTGATISQMKWEIGSEATPYRLADSDLAAPRVSTVYKRSDRNPATPDNASSSYEKPIPAGWSASLPSETNGLAVYSTTNTFYMGGFSTGWSEPQLLVDSADFEVIYSGTEFMTASDAKASIPFGFAKTGVDITTSWLTEAKSFGWYDDADDIDEVIWMATNSRKQGDAWSDTAWNVVRVKGENIMNNMIENSSFENLTNNLPERWSAGFVYEPHAEIDGQKDGQNILHVFNDSCDIVSNNFTLDSSEEFYTLSMYAKATSTTGICISVVVPQSTTFEADNAVKAEESYGTSAKTATFKLTKANEWLKVVIRMHITAGSYNRCAVKLGYKDIESYFCMPKMEKGSVATSWCLHENDKKGTPAPVVSTVFKRGNTVDKPTKGTFDSPVPTSEGWSDGIPEMTEGNTLVWSSTCTFYHDGTSSGWSEPQKLVDSTGFEVIYSPSLTKPNTPPVFTGLDSWFKQTGVKDVWYDDYTNIDPVWMATTSRDAGSTTWSNWVVTRVKGEAGESVVFADLTNEMDSFALTNDGEVAIEGDISTTVSLWKGAEHLEITGVKVCGSENFSGIGDWCSGTAGKDSDGLSYTINITVLEGKDAPEHTAIPIEVFYGDLSKTVIFTLNGVKAGNDGSPAKLYKLKPSNTQVIHKKNGTYEPVGISCSAILIVDGKEQAVIDSNIKLRYYTNGSTRPVSYTSGINIGSSTFKQVKFELVDITGTTVLNTTKVLDVETISVLEEGKDGDNGEDGSAPAWNLLNNTAFKYDEEREIEFWEIDDDIEVVNGGEYNYLVSRYTGTGQVNTYVTAARQRVTNTLTNNKWYVLSVYCPKTTSSIGSASISFGNSVYRELYLNGTKVIKGDNGSVTLANGYNEIVFQYGYDFGVNQDEYISFTLPYGTDKVFSIKQPKVEAITVDNPSLAKATAWMPSILDMSGSDGNSPQENLVLNSNFDMYESNEFDFTTVSNSFASIMSRTYGECWVRLKRYSKPEQYLYINSTENDAIPYYGPNPISIDASLWCFVGTTSSFKIYNKYAGPSKAFRVERDGPDYPWWFAEVCDASDAGNWKFGSTEKGAIAICAVGGGDTYINSYAGHENGGLSALYSLDDGSRWKVEKLGYGGLKFWEREDGYVVENSYDGFNSYALTATTGHTGISQITPNLELNTWYTLSFRFRSFNVSSALLAVILEHAFGTDDVVTSSEDSPIFGEQTTEFGFEALDSVWKTASVSFRLTSSPTKFYYTLCCTMSGSGAVYITNPKLERGKKATPYRKAETDLAGPAGETGPMLFPQGTWDAGVTYTSDSTKKPFVYHNGSYYVLEAAYSKGDNPANNNGSIWKVMDEIEYLFTKFLLANQARFGNNDGGIFYNNWLFSAKLKNGKYYGDTGYNGSIGSNGAIGDTKPVLALDFKEGKLIAENADITGHINATSGKFTGSIATPPQSLTSDSITLDFNTGFNFAGSGKKNIKLPNDKSYSGVQCSIINYGTSGEFTITNSDNSNFLYDGAIGSKKNVNKVLLYGISEIRLKALEVNNALCWFIQNTDNFGYNSSKKAFDNSLPKIPVNIIGIYSVRNAKLEKVIAGDGNGVKFSWSPIGYESCFVFTFDTPRDDVSKLDLVVNLSQNSADYSDTLRYATSIDTYSAIVRFWRTDGSSYGEKYAGLWNIEVRELV